MDPALRDLADARLLDALSQAALEDPREAYRERLRWLKEHDLAGFEAARRYYEEVLLPTVSAGGDPLAAWLEYGRRLAEAAGPGRLLEIEPGGRARVASAAPARDRLVLHLPEDLAAPALVLRRPRELSPAQRATCTLLVEGGA